LRDRLLAYLTTLNGPTGFSTKDAHVIAVDLKSGSARWKARTDASDLYTISLISRNIYAVGSNGYLYVFNSETGTLKSKIKYRGAEETGPAAIEGGVFFWSGDGSLFAMDVAMIPPVQRADDRGTEPATTVGEPTEKVTDTKPHGEEEISNIHERAAVDSERQDSAVVKKRTNLEELSQVGSDFPQIPGNQRPKGPPGLKWKIRVGEFFCSPIVVSDGLVLFFPVNSNLIAVDCANGRERWKLPNSWQPDMAVGAALLFFRGGKTLYAWDIKTRQLRWKQEEWTAGKICPASGMIVTETADGYVCGLDLNSGQVKWKFVVGRRLYRPNAHDGMVFTVASENIIYGLDLSTGRKTWELKPQEDVSSFLTVSEGVIYLGIRVGVTFACRAFDIKTSQEKWTVSCAKISAAPSVGDGMVCVPSSDCLYGVDKATGRLRWRFQTKGLWNTPAISDGRVYFRDREAFYALDSRTGGVSWKFDFGSDYPADHDAAVTDGVVYFGGNDGYLYAVDAKLAEQEYNCNN